MQYEEGDSISTLCHRLQRSYPFLKRLTIPGEISPSVFARLLSEYQNVPFTGIDDVSGRVYLFTFYQMPGNRQVSVEYAVVGNDISQTNTDARMREMAQSNQSSIGPRVEYNVASRGAYQTNEANGLGAAVVRNEARDANTNQSNRAAWCHIL